METRTTITFEGFGRRDSTSHSKNHQESHMSTKSLIPGNSQRARLTALNAFERFAVSEGLTVKQICEFISADSSGDSLYTVLDKFAVFLAFQESSKGSMLSKNSVASYFGNVKNHLLEIFPALVAVSSKRLQKIASILDKYCSKRGTDFTHQAPPCTKADLRALSTNILKGAVSPDDYKDAALLNLLWYLLGRSSDTMCLVKSQVAVYPGGCLFIKFKRLKSATNPGSSLFSDPFDFTSCPIHAIALATIMQTSPSEFLLDQLPRDTAEIQEENMTNIPLIDLLRSHADTPTGQAKVSRDKTIPAPKAAVPGIHAYVNRLLQRWSSAASANGYTLTKGLTSHSFRRGAAQNANGDCNISTSWILDRGGWSMSAVSKAFNYIVSTTHEDQTVGKTLAGWGIKDKPRLPTLTIFDAVVAQRLRLVQESLFASSLGLLDAFVLREDVLDVLTASAVLHYPDMAKLAPHSLYIKRIRQILSQKQVSELEITAWALTIHADVTKQERNYTIATIAENGPQASIEDYIRKQTTLLEQQASLISELTTQVKLLADRVRQLENGSSHAPELSKKAEAPTLAATPSSLMISQGKTQSRAKSPSSVWYEWFCDLSPFTHTNRRRYHEFKVLVAFMRLFLPGGYDMSSDDGQRKARILQSGLEAEAGIQALLAQENITAKSYGTIVKVLKRLHTDGKLNNHITRFQNLQQQGLVLDPTPQKSQHVLQPCYPTQPSQP